MAHAYMYGMHTGCVQIAELFESRVWCTALQASLLACYAVAEGNFFLCTTIYSENLCIRISNCWHLQSCVGVARPVLVYLDRELSTCKSGESSDFCLI